MFYDGYKDLAVGLAAIIQPHPACPPSDKLLRIVKLGLRHDEEGIVCIGFYLHILNKCKTFYSLKNSSLLIFRFPVFITVIRRNLFFLIPSENQETEANLGNTVQPGSGIDLEFETEGIFELLGKINQYFT